MPATERRIFYSVAGYKLGKYEIGTMKYDFYLHSSYFQFHIFLKNSLHIHINGHRHSSIGILLLI